MRTIGLVLSLLISSMAYSQDESVTVEGSKIWPPAGPISSVGTPGESGHACAEPTCGGTIDPKEPGGSAGITQAQKDKDNKDNKDKAKKVVMDMKDAIKAANDLIKALQKWLNLSLFSQNPTVSIKQNGDGTTEITASCPKLKLGAGAPESSNDKPCIEIEGDTTIIIRAKDTHERQLSYSIGLFYSCYYTRQCGPKYLTFIAGSEQELVGTLNEIIGENYFKPL